jgi:hypothetical protein
MPAQTCPACGKEYRRVHHCAQVSAQPPPPDDGLDYSDPTCGGRTATFPERAQAGIADVNGATCVLLRLDDQVFAFASRDFTQARELFRGLLKLFDHPKVREAEQ